jgi:hypothetical protein
MKGFFKFDLKASDGPHESGVKVKIVIISNDNKISMTFVNSLSDVQKYEKNITQIFKSLFPDWIFNIDRYLDSRSLDIEKSKIECHFLDEVTFEPVNQATAEG